CMEMLVESNPKVSRAAVLWDPITGTVQMESVKKVAEKLNVELDVLEVQRPSDFDTAFLMASQRGAGAMMMLSSPLVAPNVQVLAELALRHRFPAITLFPDFVLAEVERTGEPEAKIRARFCKETGLIRYGTVEDVAEFVTFIVSSRATWLPAPPWISTAVKYPQSKFCRWIKTLALN